MNQFYEAIFLKCLGREKRGFVLDRPKGTDDYLFLHFKTPVNLLEGGVIRQIQKDTCLITTPHQRHWFSSPDYELEHNWIHFIPKNSESFLQLGFPINSAFVPIGSSFITPIVQECEKEFISKEPYWEMSVSSLMSKLFVLLARECIQERKSFSSKYMRELYEQFKSFRIKLYANAGEKWDVCDMAEALSLSRSRFTVLYKEFFSVSPNADLISARISYAKYLLNGSNMKIDEIARNAGYSSEYHFIRQFKSLTGVTLGQYRIK